MGEEAASAAARRGATTAPSWKQETSAGSASNKTEVRICASVGLCQSFEPLLSTFLSWHVEIKVLSSFKLSTKK
jgi:hypothetical protein